MMELSPTEVFDVKVLFKQEEYKTKLRKNLLNNTFFSRFKKNKVYDLAEECFTNEFIWDETASETERVQKLIEDIQADKFKAPAEAVHAIALVACYRPLIQTDIADKALEYAEKADNQTYSKLLTYLIREPRQEEEIKQEIQTFGSITNKTSLEIKQQYDENPYPRWRNIKYLADTLEKQDDVKIEILIAGCGTGLEVINIAKEHPHSRITAVDLSTSCLAYAIRKTKEQGIDNVDFYCGDLLEIKELGKTYDYIVVTGVLQQLENPLQGWRALADVLEPGGGMTVSLYSELARYPVNLGRQYIHDNHLECNIKDVRKFRHHLKTDLPKEKPLVRLALGRGFYSFSEMRDILFPVLEQQFTIHQIKEALEETGLIFNGFIPKDKRLDDFLAQHPYEEDRRNLDLWHEYEVANPLSFTGMYQIACLKPAAEEGEKAA